MSLAKKVSDWITLKLMTLTVKAFIISVIMSYYVYVGTVLISEFNKVKLSDASLKGTYDTRSITPKSIYSIRCYSDTYDYNSNQT